MNQSNTFAPYRARVEEGTEFAATLNLFYDETESEWHGSITFDNPAYNIQEEELPLTFPWHHPHPCPVGPLMEVRTRMLWLNLVRIMMAARLAK